VKWTTIADVKTHTRRLWKNGELCRAGVESGDAFPLKLSFKQPTAKVMQDSFGEMQDWVKSIIHFAEKHALELEWKAINHRSLGMQTLPSAVQMNTPEQAASLIGERQSLRLFSKLYKQTVVRLPELQTWLLKRPIKALVLENAWGRLVDLCVWMQTHPNPRIYLRQVNLAGIDSKFIESHRQVLGELFDLVLPRFAINDDFSGVSGFARRYGFLDKPLMVRLRPLDKNIRLLHADGAQDVVITAQAFGHLQQDIQAQTERAFIVENEINYLAFPDMANALVVFGSGYGFDALKQATWLHQCELYYWGDLDTHGFAILNQLRAHFPHVRSLLMDRQTLLKHQASWGFEPKPEKKDLTHLTKEEAQLYNDLRCNALAEQLRLEQELIGFEHVKKHILATDKHR